jgi:hypothetical protein
MSSIKPSFTVTLCLGHQYSYRNAELIHYHSEITGKLSYTYIGRRVPNITAGRFKTEKKCKSDVMFGRRVFLHIAHEKQRLKQKQVSCE